MTDSEFGGLAVGKHGDVEQLRGRIGGEAR
jgi:hypothetical protein